MMHKRFWRMRGMMMKGFCGEGKGGHFRHPFGSFKEKMKEKLVKELNLNIDQQAKLQAIYDTVQSNHDNRKGTHTDFIKNILSQIRGEKLDESFMNTIMDHKIEAMKEFKSVMFEKISEFHASLTQEQKEKLASLMEKYHENMNGCHH